MKDRDESKELAGVISKASEIGSQEITEAELAAINRHTLTPLKAEDVYVFKAVLCDTEVDRAFDQFTEKSLRDMEKLYVGKPVIKDHVRMADNMVARIYDTEVVDTGKTLKNGDPYLQLVAKAYMVRTAGNADLIKEIEGGIKKEGSVSFRPAASYCSICGTDNTKTYCSHWPGRSYAKDTGKTICTFKLDGVKDAYEFSLVSVPAQKAAGVSKAYGTDIVFEADEDDAEKQDNPAPDTRDKELGLRARLSAQRAKATI